MGEVVGRYEDPSVEKITIRSVNLKGEVVGQVSLRLLPITGKWGEKYSEDRVVYEGDTYLGEVKKLKPGEWTNNITDGGTIWPDRGGAVRHLWDTEFGKRLERDGA